MEEIGLKKLNFTNSVMSVPSVVSGSSLATNTVLSGSPVTCLFGLSKREKYFLNDNIG